MGLLSLSGCGPWVTVSVPSQTGWTFSACFFRGCMAAKWKTRLRVYRRGVTVVNTLISTSAGNDSVQQAVTDIDGR